MQVSLVKLGYQLFSSKVPRLLRCEILRDDLETNFDLVHSAEFYVMARSLTKFDYRCLR